MAKTWRFDLQGLAIWTPIFLRRGNCFDEMMEQNACFAWATITLKPWKPMNCTMRWRIFRGVTYSVSTSSNSFPHLKLEMSRTPGFFPFLSLRYSKKANFFLLDTFLGSSEDHTSMRWRIILCQRVLVTHSHRPVCKV